MVERRVVASERRGDVGRNGKGGQTAKQETTWFQQFKGSNPLTLVNSILDTLKSIVSALAFFIALFLSACGEEYVPLEKRVTFEQCDAIRKELQTFLMGISFSNHEDLEKVQQAANEWIRPDRSKNYEKIEDVINICSIKQAFDKEANRDELPDYNEMYTLLVALDIEIKLFLEDIQSEKPREWMIWRGKQLDRWLERTRQSVSRQLTP